MSLADNKDLVRRYLTVAYDERRPDVVDEFFSPDYVNHDPGPGLPPTREGERQLVKMITDAFPDMRSTIQDQVAEDDLVFTQWTAVATHQGEIGGMPPTGRRVLMAGHEICRIRDGRIVEYWVDWDAAGLFRQLTAPQEEMGA